MDSVRIRVAFLSVTDAERGEGIVRMKVEPKYINSLRAYGLEHKLSLGDSMVVIEPWNWDPSKEMGAFFHKVRDLIVIEQSGPMGARDKVETDRVKQELKERYGPKDKKSLTEYTRGEMWALNQGAVESLYEAGGNLGALRVDFDKLKEQ